MAKKQSRQDEIFEMLRAHGLRKRVARTIAEATGKSTSRTPKVLRNAASDLKALASDLEDRATGGPAKRKAAAQKAANTRKRKAKARSESAKKAAKTRAKSNGSAGGTRRRATARSK